MSVEMLPKEHDPAHSVPMLAAPQPAKRSLIDFLPVKLLVLLASPYLAGKDYQEALVKAQELFSRHHFCGTLDVLGEDAGSSFDCDQYVETYRKVIDAVAADPIRSSFDREKLTVSMKPSMFSYIVPTAAQGQPGKMDEAFDRIARVVDYAHRRNIRITLEAEDYRWAGFHLDAYNALINAGYSNLGTVIQTRLFRTKKDLARFDERSRVRLVIGIYQEPANIAYTNVGVMKDLLVQYAQELLARGTYVEFATHDAHTIDRFFKQVVLPGKVPSTQFETQFLLGVPRLKLQKSLVSGDYFRNLQNSQPNVPEHADALRRSGVLVRLYLPYGRDAVAGPYCKRRIIHNPNMIVYGIKNLLGIES
jgi:proline dehydrogenase